MSDLDKILHFWEEEILWTYNFLARKYQSDKKVMLLLWIAYKKAINWELRMLLDFETDLESNEHFFKKRFIINNIKDWISSILFSSWEEILENLKKSSARKRQLVSILYESLWFNYNVSFWHKDFPYSLLTNLLYYLNMTYWDFNKSFPSIHDKLIEISDWVNDWDEWLEFVLTLLFSIWDKTRAVENLSAVEKSLWARKEVDIETKMIEKENKYDLNKLRLRLIWIWIYSDFSPIKWNNFDLSLEQRLRLKSELEQKFWIPKKWDYIFDKFQWFEHLTLEQIIDFIEELVFLEVCKLVKNFSQKDWEYMEENIERIKDRTFQIYMEELIFRFSWEDFKAIETNDDNFWIDILYEFRKMTENELQKPKYESLSDLIDSFKK